MWSFGGWLVVLDGGFTKTYRHSTHSVRVDGPAGVLMAFIFFLLSAIAASILLESLGIRRRWVLAVSATLMAAPAIYLLIS